MPKGAVAKAVRRPAKKVSKVKKPKGGMKMTPSATMKMKAK